MIQVFTRKGFTMIGKEINGEGGIRTPGTL